MKIRSMSQRIIKAVYNGKAQLAKERLENKLPVMSAERLQHQEYLKPHTSKKKERRIFVICSDNERRPRLLALFNLNSPVKEDENGTGTQKPQF